VEKIIAQFGCELKAIITNKIANKLSKITEMKRCITAEKKNLKTLERQCLMLSTYMNRIIR